MVNEYDGTPGTRGCTRGYDDAAVNARAAAPALTSGRGRGRGRGKGKSGGPAPAAAAAQRYVWVDAEHHTFTPRAAFDGPEDWALAPSLSHLTAHSPSHEFLEAFDAPAVEYVERAANSERYRDSRHMHDQDGPGARHSPK